MASVPRRCDADDDETDPRRVVDEESHVLVADERPHEAARRDTQESQPDEREDPAARDERTHRPERPQEAGDLRELLVLHDGRTLRHE